MAISRDTVICGFRLILGRDPGDEEGIRLHMGLPDETALAEALIGSLEFSMLKRFSHLVELRKTPAAPPVNAEPEAAKRTATTALTIAVFGNCQSRGLTSLFRAMTGRPDVAGFEVTKAVRDRLDKGELDDVLLGADLIYFHGVDVRDSVVARLPRLAPRTRLAPAIAFPAFHPDIDYVMDAHGVPVSGLLGEYQSSIVFHAWQQELSPAQALALFNARTYRHLGFHDFWASSRAHLLHIGEICGFPIEEHLKVWSRTGTWMYSMNHPKLHVLADIARALLAKEGIRALPQVDEFMDDDLALGPAWPVYPEIAQNLGLDGGGYDFKLQRNFCSKDNPVQFVGLEELITASYELFGRYPRGSLRSARVESERYRTLPLTGSSVQQMGGPALATPVAAGGNPYQSLPDERFWRRAVERTPMADVDPVVSSSIVIGPQDRVATAGSCFAQNISRTLKSSGFNYFVPEAGEGLPPAEASARNFGVYSCRYGNVYTARQLVQLFDRAYGHFVPGEQHWQRADGRWVDPFRPQIEPEGLPSPDAVHASLLAHLADVRRMFEQLDVFVFTLGLTEGWRDRADGAVYPLAPGVAGGRFDPARHEFVNFSVGEVASDMALFLDKLKQVNPHARVLLTVSPVPLVATYESRHVLVSTTLSKSVLRAAAQQVVDAHPHCMYFPSFEVITGNFNRGAYFEDDLRSINAEGVAHVMRLFMRHCSTSGEGSPLQADLAREIRAMSEVICDESAIDAAAGAAAPR